VRIYDNGNITVTLLHGYPHPVDNVDNLSTQIVDNLCSPIFQIQNVDNFAQGSVLLEFSTPPTLWIGEGEKE